MGALLTVIAYRMGRWKKKSLVHVSATGEQDVALEPDNADQLEKE